MLDKLWNVAGPTLEPAPKAEKNSLRYTVIQLMLWINLTAFRLVQRKPGLSPLWGEVQGIKASIPHQLIWNYKIPRVWIFEIYKSHQKMQAKWALVGWFPWFRWQFPPWAQGGHLLHPLGCADSPGGGQSSWWMPRRVWQLQKCSQLPLCKLTWAAERGEHSEGDGC